MVNIAIISTNNFVWLIYNNKAVSHRTEWTATASTKSSALLLMDKHALKNLFQVF